MKNLVSIIALLLIGMTAWAQKSEVATTYSDTDILSESDLKENIVIEFTQKGDTLTSQFRNDVPNDPRGLYANGTLMRYQKQFYILTDADCIIDSIKRRNAIIDEEIAMLPVKNKSFGKSKATNWKFSYQMREGIYSFSFVANVGGKWKLRTVKGKLIALPIDFRDSLEGNLREKLSIYLDIEARQLNGDSLQTVKDLVSYIKANYAQRFIFLNSMYLNELVTEIADVEFRMSVAGNVFMEIPKEIVKDVKRSWGSALWDPKREVVGVTIGEFKFNEKHYIRFATINNQISRKLQKK